MRHFKEIIIENLKQFMQEMYTDEELDRMLQISTRQELGEFTFPCFKLAKEWYYQNSQELAEDIKERVSWNDTITPEVAGGYLNFRINPEALTSHTLEEVLEKEDRYGSNEIGEGKMIVLDYSAPNIGKPLHVGHIRSTILGDSIIRILNFNGYQTHGINYLGDVGLHIGKIVTAYNEWGDEEKLRENPEQKILNLYIEFCNKEKEDEEYTKRAQKVVEKIESGDEQTMKTLEFIDEMSMVAFNRVYYLLGVEFDEITGQSKFSNLGKEFVQEALEKQIAYKDEEGGIIVKLKDEGLPNKVILRADGTAIYSTQDLGAAKYRKDTFDFHKLLYVVASEQELYFKQIFKILEKAGYDWAQDCIHINFGMINLKEGKMSTREGKIVYLEEVLNKAIDKARTMIEEKNPELENKEQVSEMVGVGAIKYMVLNVDYHMNIEFSWDRALDLHGNSATYIQYSHARAESILRRASVEPGAFRPNDLETQYEKNLVRKIAEFPLIVESAGVTFKPHIIANYSNELSSVFNQFYNKVRVLDDSEKTLSRINLVAAAAQTMRNSMCLLGIQLPDRM